MAFTVGTIGEAVVANGEPRTTRNRLDLIAHGGDVARLVLALQFISWCFAGAFVVATAITWKYFFTAPVVFSAVITLGLAWAAWRARLG